MHPPHITPGSRSIPTSLPLVVALALCLPWLEAEARGRLPGRGRGQDPLATQRWQTGRGAPRGTIVYLHGLGCNAADPLIKSLVRELNRSGDSFKVVSPWLRPVRAGRGGVVDAGLHTMTDQLRRARRTIEQQPGKVVLVGHSFGGKAALKLAREYPGKVACVVGLAPSVNMLHSYWKRLTGERGLPGNQARVRQTISDHRGRLVRRLARARGQGDRDAVEGLSDAVNYADVMKDLVSFNEPRVEGSVRTPTLVLHGTQDQAVSVHYARRFAERNRGTRLVEIQGVNHAFKPTEISRRNVGAELSRQITRFIDPHLGGN